MVLGVFEAYSASYLTTREHMLAVKSERFNLSWVNCEMASFIHMRETNNFYVNPNGHGMIMQVFQMHFRLKICRKLFQISGPLFIAWCGMAWCG